MTRATGWEAAEIGRLLYTHRLDPQLAAGALGINADDAVALAAGTASADLVPAERHPHARLLLNVLIRVELRCGHDPVAIRAALERPLAELGGGSISARLRDEVSLAQLHELRAAAGAMPIPKVRMWRVADRYS